MLDPVAFWIALFHLVLNVLCVELFVQRPTSEEMPLPRIYVLLVDAFYQQAFLRGRQEILLTPLPKIWIPCNFLFAKLWADCMCKCWGLAMQCQVLTLAH